MKRARWSQFLRDLKIGRSACGVGNFARSIQRSGEARGRKFSSACGDSAAGHTASSGASLSLSSLGLLRHCGISRIESSRAGGHDRKEIFEENWAMG